MPKTSGFRELRVYQNAIEAAMKIFEITKTFPADEKFSMVDQMRRSVLFVRTSPKRGENEFIKHILSVN